MCFFCRFSCSVTLQTEIHYCWFWCKCNGSAPCIVNNSSDFCIGQNSHNSATRTTSIVRMALFAFHSDVFGDAFVAQFALFKWSARANELKSLLFRTDDRVLSLLHFVPIQWVCLAAIWSLRILCTRLVVRNWFFF